MQLSLIVAVGAGNGVIGTAAGLPWHLPADLARFKALTLGKPVLMGRTTREQIGRPLPGRANIVLSRRPDYSPAGSLVAGGVEPALELAARELTHSGGDESVVIGGAEVYRQFFERVGRVYLTVVHGEFTGDTHFPAELLAALRDATRWRAEGREECAADGRNAHAHTFTTLVRAALG